MLLCCVYNKGKCVRTGFGKMFPLCFRLIGGSDYKLIYRHYATLYFVFCVDSSESELGILDLIQVMVWENHGVSVNMLCTVSVFDFVIFTLNSFHFRYLWKRWTNALRMSVSLTSFSM